MVCISGGWCVRGGLYNRRVVYAPGGSIYQVICVPLVVCIIEGLYLPLVVVYIR